MRDLSTFSLALLVSAALLAFATATGLVLGYAIPWAAVLSREHRPVLSDANGTWFIWVVASQSVATAAATIEPAVTVGQAELAVFVDAAGRSGFGACVVMVALRLMLYPLSPTDLNPPCWVSMGAMAITVVAGSKIVEMTSTPIVEATGGLIAVGIWRHWVHKVPLRYETTWWSIVFPLGRYAVAGMYLGRAAARPIVEQIGDGWLWVAVAAWLFAAVLRVHSWFTPRRGAAQA